MHGIRANISFKMCNILFQKYNYIYILGIITEFIKYFFEIFFFKISLWIITLRILFFVLEISTIIMFYLHDVYLHISMLFPVCK